MGNKIGKAYGFLDYEGRWAELIGFMEINKDKANFPNNLSFIVLDDKVSTRDVYDNERKKLPAKIAEAAEATDVYGSVSIDEIGNLPKASKRAADLRYIIMAQAPEVSDSEFAEPLGQGKANQVTARMLNEVLSLLGSGECHAGHSKFLRAAVFYQDGHGKAQRH